MTIVNNDVYWLSFITHKGKSIHFTFVHTKTERNCMMRENFLPLIRTWQRINFLLFAVQWHFLFIEGV